MSITTPNTPLTAPLEVLEPTRRQPAGAAVIPQYSRRRIAAIWAAAALPMAFLAWVLAPWLAGRLDGPNALPEALLVCLTGGLIWQFVLVVGLVAREQGTLRWSRVREALWLRAPRDPGTGRRSRRAWLLLVPLVLAFGVEELLPTISPAAGHDMGTFLSSDAGHAFLSGAWGWFALIAVLGLFNTVLGEELLFRGLLLPRMNGAFGDKDWLANGVLFAGYHLHMPWVIPWTLLDSVLLAYPSKRYRSALMGIAVHSAQTVVILGITLSLVLR
jgi:membrane protease YdiL (CAAX protease family)